MTERKPVHDHDTDTYTDDHALFFYLGVCNSTLFYWLAHVMGRWEGQGDLQLLVYELKRFQIPDLRKVSRSHRMKVVEIMQKLIALLKIL